MIIATVALLVIVMLAVVYAFLVMPRAVDSADMDLQSTDYALRGLHSQSIPENSLSAFALAKQAGYGIALDLRLSSDGNIFVFRDEDLTRLCGIKKDFCELSSREIKALYIKNSNERIPLLTEVLSLVDGHVPLLIEIKNSPDADKLCRALAEILDTYSGAFAIQSFEPRILEFFKKYRPRFARGQMVTKYTKGRATDGAPKNALLKFARFHMLTNIISRPDFISIDGKHLREPAFLLATRVFHSKGFVFTVRNEKQYSICRKNSLYAIFENIKPK